jgi:hypothetical protein
MPEQDARAVHLEEACAAFDLSVGPLMRARLVRVSPEDHALVLTFHRIVADDASVAMLLVELSELYSRSPQFDPQTGAPPDPQFREFVGWERDWSTQAGAAAEIDYWRRTLANAPELLQLPTDRTRPAVQSYRGERVSIMLAPP